MARKSAVRMNPTTVNVKSAGKPSSRTQSAKSGVKRKRTMRKGK